MALRDLDAEELSQLAERARRDYEELRAKDLHLDLTRGKPSVEQLDHNERLLSLPGEGDHTAADGSDVRNYGGLDGLKELRELWGEVVGIPAERLLAADGSSLNIMFDVVSFSHLFGTQDSPRPWSKEETVRWLCPVPGYDRHFTISETFGHEMIPVPTTEEGPDLDVVREHLADPSVKGMWLVPTFSNPAGVTTSRAVLEGLAAMPAAAPDFRIAWDDAYAVHPLTGEFPEHVDVPELAGKAGNPNRFWCFSSTSKVTFAGAGVGFFGSSAENLAWYKRYAGARGIGPNKVNQLAHARYFGSAEGVRAIMRHHAGVLVPKFATVERILSERLGGLGIAKWTRPAGGYFVSLDVVPGTAARVVELAREAGVALTEAGSSFPHHRDPEDKNIRLAPSMPPLGELEDAVEAVATCAILAAAERLAEG